MSDGGIYLVKVKKNVLKTIEHLEQSVQKRVASVLRSLVFCPRPPGSVKIQGRPDTWRLRLGNIRVVYEIHDEILTICIVRVAHRKDVYKNL